MKTLAKLVFVSLLLLSCEDSSGNDSGGGGGISGNLESVSSVDGATLSSSAMQTSLNFNDVPTAANSNTDVTTVKNQAVAWNSYIKTMIDTYNSDNSGDGEASRISLAGYVYTISRGESGDFYTYTYNLDGEPYIEAKIAKNLRSGFYEIHMDVLYSKIISSTFDYSGSVRYNFEIHSDGKTVARYLYDYAYSIEVAGQKVDTEFEYDGRFLLNSDNSGKAEMAWRSSGFESNTCKEWTSAGVVSDCN